MNRKQVKTQFFRVSKPHMNLNLPISRIYKLPEFLNSGELSKVPLKDAYTKEVTEKP